MAKINAIEGIGPAFQEKLERAGVSTVEGLLEKGGSDSARATLAEASGIPQKRIDTWVSMADLFRIKGIASQFGELLVRSGVGSVSDLAKADATELRAALEATNAEKNMVRVIPIVESLHKFIKAAGEL
ncbi:MAG: putative flap endonuclease-1-like 5' DNA nuclease [Cognaticolwellia sp.]|jgi:predicted flap endonuclease-1-like 5' DNA nuclease|tara:strand:+ start:309 stop:695 length:387 start_codon:yes stop_codon:yes gene_type:complete